MREEALAQVEPDALDWVELGAAGRQRQERDIVRHGELWREMPAGPVEEQHGVGAGCQLLGEGSQEQRHGLGRGAWQGQRKGLLGAGPAGGEQVEAVVALIREAGRAHAALVPAVADPALLAEPRFILAPELDLPAWMGRGDGGEPRPKSIF
jgi:hypothetical protein